VQQPVIQLGTAIDGDIFPGRALDGGQKIKPGSHFHVVPFIKTSDMSKGILANDLAQPRVAHVTATRLRSSAARSAFPDS
jgi:hypothetical protein